MDRYTSPNWKRFPFEILALATLVLAFAVLDPDNPALGYVGFSALLLCFCLGVVRAWVLEDDHQQELELAVDDAVEGAITSTNDVDIWKYQAELMAMSGQTMPSRPTLHNGVLMYAALNAEELGETFGAVADVIAGVPYGGLPQGGGALGEIYHTLRIMQQQLRDHSLGIRHYVAQLPPGFAADIRKEDAVELLDGVTDVAVVLAGMGLSAGLPVRAGYQDVGVSNLSKANPVTGVIDKDSSGKWIKGSQYHKPNLEAVLAKHYAPGA